MTMENGAFISNLPIKTSFPLPRLIARGYTCGRIDTCFNADRSRTVFLCGWNTWFVPKSQDPLVHGTCSIRMVTLW